MNQMPHEKWAEKIIAKVTGELDAEDSALFDSHIQSCPQCTQELKEYELLSRRLYALEKGVTIPVLSSALLTLKQEIAQHHLLEEVPVSENGDSFVKEESQSGRARVPTEKWEVGPTIPAEEIQILNIVRRAKAGNRAAFTLLYRRYYIQIYRYLFRMVGNQADASDLAIVTFQKAWEGLQRLRDEQKFLSWLYRIATHTALDSLRLREARQPFWELPSKNLTDVRAACFSFEDGIVEQELIKLALMEVAPHLRTCMLLKLEGLSQAKIAELLGLDRESVSTYISKGRKQFHAAYRRLRADMSL